MFFILDKIYEARHKLLNLYPEPIVQAKIPATYFSSSEQDFSASALVEILSSVPNSPLTPANFLQNLTPTFPNAMYANKIVSRAHDSALTSANLHYHTMQQQQQQSNQQVCNMAPNNNTPNSAINELQTFSNISPRSINANTSGYLSQLSSQFGNLNISGNSSSLEQLNPQVLINFQQQENQMIMGGAVNNISKHLNENHIRKLEMENYLSTPIYNSVCSYEFLFFGTALRKTFSFSLEQLIMTENVLKV